MFLCSMFPVCICLPTNLFGAFCNAFGWMNLFYEHLPSDNTVLSHQPIYNLLWVPDHMKSELGLWNIQWLWQVTWPGNSAPIWADWVALVHAEAWETITSVVEERCGIPERKRETGTVSDILGWPLEVVIVPASHVGRKEGRKWCWVHICSL